MADILNHHLISERYFFPRIGNFASPFWVDCGDAKLACSYHEIDPAAKTVIHFHGNGEIVDDWQGDFVSLVQQMGCNVFLAELRGYVSLLVRHSWARWLKMLCRLLKRCKSLLAN